MGRLSLLLKCRETKQRDYEKLDAHGFTISDKDILDRTDPYSNQFDEESDGKYLNKEDIQKIIERVSYKTKNIV